MTSIEFWRTASAEDIRETAPTPKISFFLLPYSVTEIEIFIALKAFVESGQHDALIVYSGMTGLAQFSPDLADQMNWFFGNTDGRIVIAATDFSRGLFWDDNGEFLLGFGNDQFVKDAHPFPAWLSKSRFVNGSIDESRTGWADEFWEKFCG